MPAKIIAVADIPRTKSGKITELAVRDVVHGREVKNKEALANARRSIRYRDLVERCQAWPRARRRATRRDPPPAASGDEAVPQEMRAEREVRADVLVDGAEEEADDQQAGADQRVHSCPCHVIQRNDAANTNAPSAGCRRSCHW